MKMITGLLQVTSGRILFDGELIERDFIAYKQRMGYVPEEPHRYAHLSGLEYLVTVGQAQLHNPDLLLLDEPFSGLGVGTGLVPRSLIQQVAARGNGCRH